MADNQEHLESHMSKSSRDVANNIDHFSRGKSMKQSTASEQEARESKLPAEKFPTEQDEEDLIVEDVDND